MIDEATARTEPDPPPPPEPKPGEHAWVVLAMFRVVPESGKTTYDLYTNCLLKVEGPGCLMCKVPYSEGSLMDCIANPRKSGTRIGIDSWRCACTSTNYNEWNNSQKQCDLCGCKQPPVIP